MRLKLLGRSGLRVSELCLGTMTFGEDWGWGASRDVSRQIFDAYVAAGGNFIDTSCNYTEGTAEKFVGEFTRADRDYFVIATKYSLNLRKSDPNAGGNSRKNLRRSVEGSLQRLQTDHLDLLYLHMWDYVTPIDEVMRALDDLVRAGKVLHIGASDMPAWEVARANTLADARGWTPFVAMQAPYSLLDRALERETIPMARALDLALLPWGLLEAGQLTGKYNTPSDEPKRNQRANESALKLAEVLRGVANELGRTPSQIAINWARQQGDDRHAPIIPILGARTLAQIQDNLGVLDFALTPEQLKRLSDASPIDLSFPRDFLESDHIHNLIFGETYEKLDIHRPA
jgi:aryl-alcohol dehydrogenase-like predicted oxidoreductase